MTPISLFAVELFNQYKNQLSAEVAAYTRLKTEYPLQAFPVYAARVWRLGALAEGWGAIASKLDGRVDYLNRWREGGAS